MNYKLIAINTKWMSGETKIIIADDGKEFHLSWREQEHQGFYTSFTAITLTFNDKPVGYLRWKRHNPLDEPTLAIAVGREIRIQYSGLGTTLLENGCILLKQFGLDEMVLKADERLNLFLLKQGFYLDGNLAKVSVNNNFNAGITVLNKSSIVEEEQVLTGNNEWDILFSRHQSGNWMINYLKDDQLLLDALIKLENETMGQTVAVIDFEYSSHITCVDMQSHRPKQIIAILSEKRIGFCGYTNDEEPIEVLLVKYNWKPSNDKLNYDWPGFVSHLQSIKEARKWLDILQQIPIERRATILFYFEIIQKFSKNNSEFKPESLIQLNLEELIEWLKAIPAIIEDTDPLFQYMIET